MIIIFVSFTKNFVANNNNLWRLMDPFNMSQENPTRFYISMCRGCVFQIVCDLYIIEDMLALQERFIVCCANQQLQRSNLLLNSAWIHIWGDFYLYHCYLCLYLYRLWFLSGWGHVGLAGEILLFVATINSFGGRICFLRHIGLLEADEDKIRKIRPKGTQVRMLYVPREAIRP